MAIPTLTAIPDRFTAGNTVIFSSSPGDFPAPGWDLTLWLSLNGGTPVSVAATDSGTGHLITITKAISAALPPGRYRYSLVATTMTETATTEEGIVDVLPNPAAAQTLSTTAAILATLEETIQTLAAGPNLSVNFSGQTFTKKDINQLYDLRLKLQAQLRSEQSALNPTGHDQARIVTRFV